MWRGKGSGRRCSRQWHWWHDNDDWWHGNDDWWHGNDDGWHDNDDWWHGNDDGNHSYHPATISDGRETLQVQPHQQAGADDHPHHPDTISDDEISLAEQDESNIDPCCFQRKAASEILKMLPGRTATIESMVVTTFQNGDGSDVEVFMRVSEKEVFLFRRSICALDDDTQSSEILGWQIPEDLTVDMYVWAMRLQYFTSSEPRYATYVNELEEATTSEKAIISCTEEGQISVMMPTMKMSTRLEKPNNYCRVPSPVVRALFGEPPFKLKHQTSFTTVRDPNIELCPWVQYVLKPKSSIIATRQTKAGDVVPLSPAEIMEHKRPKFRQKTRLPPEALQELIQGAVAGREASDRKGWNEFQVSVWKCFAAYIEEDSVHEDFKGALANTASQMWKTMGCSSATGGVVCYICARACNQLAQFHDHCVGQRHWKRVKELR